MNTIFEETMPEKTTTSFGRTVTLSLTTVLLTFMLAGVAWILNYELVSVLLISTLPGIGLFMILGMSQEEKD